MKFKTNGYLAGPITCYFKSGEMDKAKRWRTFANRIFNECGIGTYDPTVFAKELFENSPKCDNAIILQNYKYLSQCDFILVDVSHIEDSIGTIWEMSIAWQQQKPVFAFGDCKGLCFCFDNHHLRG